MYALFERGKTDDFRGKHPKYKYADTFAGVGVIEVFAELFSKSDRILL